MCIRDRLKPFVRSLWGAIAKDMPRPQANLVFVKQIRPALVWLQRFARGCHGGLVREHRLCARWAEGVVIQTDASLWGGGAIFWHTYSGYLRDDPPDEYIALAWNKNHGVFLGVLPGDEAGQATFEAYMMLEAIVCWITEDTLGRILLVGDAEGVLFGLTRFSAKAQIINEIAKEIALHLAPFG